MLVTLVSTTTLFSDEIFVEGGYNYLNGKATSYVNTANDNTSGLSAAVGYHFTNSDIRTYIDYTSFSWTDANANFIAANVEYLKAIGNSDASYYVGAGVGMLAYEVDSINDSFSGVAYTAKAGLAYNILAGLYMKAGLKYINTNSAQIKDDAYNYSQLQNMLGGEIVLGYSFGRSKI